MNIAIMTMSDGLLPINTVPSGSANWEPLPGPDTWSLQLACAGVWVHNLHALTHTGSLLLYTATHAPTHQRLQFHRLRL